jgi:hypothetical protein
MTRWWPARTTWPREWVVLASRSLFAGYGAPSSPPATPYKLTLLLDDEVGDKAVGEMRADYDDWVFLADAVGPFGGRFPTAAP